MANPISKSSSVGKYRTLAANNSSVVNKSSELVHELHQIAETYNQTNKHSGNSDATINLFYDNLSALKASYRESEKQGSHSAFFKLHRTEILASIQSFVSAVNQLIEIAGQYDLKHYTHFKLMAAQILRINEQALRNIGLYFINQRLRLNTKKFYNVVSTTPAYLSFLFEPYTGVITQLSKIYTQVTLVETTSKFEGQFFDIKG